MGRSGASSPNTAHAVHGKVAAAVKEMQGALQEELHDDHLQLYRKLGQGGFGTVYHGTPPPTIDQITSPSCICTKAFP